MIRIGLAFRAVRREVPLSGLGIIRPEHMFDKASDDRSTQGLTRASSR